jgi:hypothetical protein
VADDRPRRGSSVDPVNGRGRHNATLRAFDQRLVAASKAKKLVVIVKALVQNGQPWRAPRSA